MSSPKLLHSLDDAAEVLSISRRVMDRLVRDGVIDSVTIGRRRLIPADSLADYIDRLKASA